MADPDPDSPTCVMLERYEGALQRSSEKEKDKDENKGKNISRDEARSRMKMMAPRVKCNISKLELKLDE